MALQGPKPIPPKVIRRGADCVVEWGRKLREIEPEAELDFSWSRDAVTICDMRMPNALRYGDLYKSAEIARDEDLRPGDFEKRVAAFMGRA